MFSNTLFKNFISLFLLSLFFCANGQDTKTEFINPTGGYKTHFKSSGNEALPQGILKVKLLKQNKIVISLSVQNGKPLLRSGNFIDTVNYKNNYAEYTSTEIDSTCKITFRFSSNGVEVKQTSRFKNYQCDFANGVNADGFYYKESSQIPIFK